MYRSAALPALPISRAFLALRTQLQAKAPENYGHSALTRRFAGTIAHVDVADRLYLLRIQET
jgi:hypothetical protein